MDKKFMFLLFLNLFFIEGADMTTVPFQETTPDELTLEHFNLSTTTTPVPPPTRRPRRTRPTQPPYTGPTTEMWFGKGDECLNRVFVVYQLRMSEKEYVCLCYDICHETEEEFDKAKNIIIADSKREQDEEHIIVQGCMYGLIFLTGLFGNILVLISVSRFMGRMTVTNMYVLNLAAADLLVILFCVPAKMMENILLRWPHELKEIGCRIALWLYFGSFMCSAFTLMCMALERYMVINHPMRMQSISSYKRTGIILFCIWIAGIALSSPAFAISELYNSYCVISSPFRDVDRRLPFYLYIFIAIFVVPSTLMAFAYVRISVTLWKSIQTHKVMQNPKKKGEEEKPKDNQAAGRVQVIRVLISVLVVFIICWAPYLSMQIYRFSAHNASDTKKNKLINDITIWLNFLSLANSCLNPILYGAMSRSFRMGFIRCLTCNKKGREPVKSYISASNTTRVLNSKNTSVTNAYAMTKVGEENEPPKTDNIKSEPDKANGDVSVNPAYNGDVVAPNDPKE